MTSFKAYQDITRDELRAVVDEAHRRGLKVTGHLCSVTYEEAAEIGIDNLEHGFLVNTALDPDKQPDTCSASHGDYTLEHLSDYDANRLIALLVKHHVAITSTLPLRAAVVARESGADHGPLPREAVMEAMSPHARDAYSYWRNRPLPTASKAAALLRRRWISNVPSSRQADFLSRGPIRWASLASFQDSQISASSSCSSKRDSRQCRRFESPA